VHSETAGIAAFESPAVLRAESALEAPMLPRTSFVVPPVVAVLIVTHPHSSVVHVRRIGMSGLIAVIPLALVLIVAILILALLVLALLVLAVLIMTGLVWPAVIVMALLLAALINPVLFLPGLFLPRLLRPGLLWTALFGPLTGVIGVRAALRRRSRGVPAAWVSVVFVLVFLRKCRG